jgi:hypothetical protein
LRGCSRLARLIGAVSRIDEPIARLSCAGQWRETSFIGLALCAVFSQYQLNGHYGSTASGGRGEAIVAQELKAEGQIILGSQVRAETSDGVRIIDHLVEDAGGGVRAVEVKTGNAVRSPSQTAKDAAMATEGATITGRNAPSTMRGQKVILDTEVRKPNQ